MRAEFHFAIPLLFGFLLTLARVGGVVTFIPMPGFTSTPRLARMVLAVALAVALSPVWPRIEVPPTAGRMAMWMAVEAALGVAAGVMVAFLGEALLMACQTLGLQAGYSFATTVDPTSQADSGVLQVFGKLAASLFFFAFGLDRHVIRAFAASLATHPPGEFRLTPDIVDSVIRLSSGMFVLGLRLALPVVALLLLVDLSLALMNRINAQLQLLTLAFPAKMLIGLVMLAILSTTIGALYQQAAGRTVAALTGLMKGS
jgi:flagellar biosynthetic protein FliR